MFIYLFQICLLNEKENQDLDKRQPQFVFMAQRSEEHYPSMECTLNPNQTKQMLHSSFNLFIQNAKKQSINEETFNSLLTMYLILIQHFIKKGHDQEIIQELQFILDQKINNDNDKIEIHLFDKFIAKNKVKEQKNWPYINTINMKDEWPQNQKKQFDKYVQKCSRSGKFIIITLYRWIGITKSVEDSPTVLLRNNLNYYHTRPIIQFTMDPLYTFYHGGDCNGEIAGNLKTKHGRCLDALTNKHRNRNLIYTKGLKWNDVVIPFSDIDDGDVNPILHIKQNNKDMYGCVPITALFNICYIFAVIYNYEKIMKYHNLLQKYVLKHKGNDKDFTGKHANCTNFKKLDQNIRFPITKLLKNTIQILINYVTNITQKEFYIQYKKETQQNYEIKYIQAKFIPKKGQTYKRKENKLRSKKDRKASLERKIHSMINTIENEYTLKPQETRKGRGKRKLNMIVNMNENDNTDCEYENECKKRKIM